MSTSEWTGNQFTTVWSFPAFSREGKLEILRRLRRKVRFDFLCTFSGVTLKLKLMRFSFWLSLRCFKNDEREGILAVERKAIA